MTTAAETALDRRVETVRRFNRFYTRQIGVLNEGLAHSPFSLTEARVLYELAQHERLSASEIGKELGLDAGYLSRILRGFEERGLIERIPSEMDGRQSLISLTDQGRSAFAPLEAGSRAEVEALLGRLRNVEQERVIDAMRAIEALLSERIGSRDAYLLRPPLPGDMGWIIHRHGALYAKDYGWDERFEALVAEIVTSFVRQHDARRERCWIAERAGKAVGSVFLVKESDDVAKLRLLLVDPAARGLGIGARLVAECERFARHAGYKRITLWTNDVLHAARHIYEKAGYRLVHEEPHHSFGHDLVGETWELELRGAGE
jgi:DNA-binding MarR family transcriptional regulator/N-acetylglutamate synthase-like GNAT family acetyltransferase